MEYTYVSYFGRWKMPIEELAVYYAEKRKYEFAKGKNREAFLLENESTLL